MVCVLGCLVNGIRECVCARASGIVLDSVVEGSRGEKAEDIASRVHAKVTENLHEDHENAANDSECNDNELGEANEDLQ